MDLVEAVQPKVAIASSTVDANTIAQVRKRKIQLFLTKRDGAIQWTGGKFEATLEPTINSTSLL